MPHSDYLVIEEQDGEFVVTDFIEENFPADGKIEIPEGVNRINAQLFNYFHPIHGTISAPITGVTIAGSVKELPYDLFYGNRYLKEVKLNKGIKIINMEAFDTTSVESIEIPDGLQVIANAAFNNCEELKYISIPSSVDRIGIQAFNNNMRFPKDFERIDFRGSKEQWDKIIKSAYMFPSPVTIYCNDGIIEGFTGGDEEIQVSGDCLPRRWDGTVLPGWE